MAVDTLPPRSPSPPPGSGGPGTGSTGRLARLRALGDVHLNRWAVAGLVVALTLVSLFLRTRQMNFYYWIDEAISVGISSHPLSQLPHLLREDGSPPLYYLLLHVWMSAFGQGEAATHALSLVFGAITVPVAYWAGASLFGRRVGAISAILAAAVPFLTSYAQETRMYAMLLLLALLVATSFVHVFVYRHRRYLVLFSLSLAAALYTHNWALFLGLATGLAWLFCVWATPLPRRELWRDGLIGFGVTALLFVPWLPTLLYQAQHTGAPWALPPVFWSLPDAFYFIVGGRGAAMTLLLGAGVGLVGAATGLWAAGPGRFAVREGEPEQRRDRTAALALLVIGLGTLLIAFVYAKTTPAWSGRYLAVIVGPCLLVTALGLSRARGIGVVALVFVCLFWVLDPRASSLYAKSNVAAVAHVMRHHTGPTTLVLSTQPEEVPTLAHYLPKVTHYATPLGSVPDPRVVDWRNALTRFEHSSVHGTLVPMLQQLAVGDRVLLVVPEIFQTAPKWMTLIKRSSVRWERYLKHDRSLKLIIDQAPHQFATGLPVRGLLFEVRRAGA
ncbi:MAG: glycosyltransferase family 39 protein [Solirubrobacteraceae bacterium]